MKIRFMSNVLLLAVCLEQNPNFFPKQSERGLICAPRPLLTGAVHLSHFEYKTLKVLRSSKYSLLTPPALCAHKSPPFLGNIIKRRGLLPYCKIVSALFSVSRSAF